MAPGGPSDAVDAPTVPVKKNFDVLVFPLNSGVTVDPEIQVFAWAQPYCATGSCNRWRGPLWYSYDYRLLP